tara:strand:+ start:391 stop:501 length:111 start_codon:yes stop_codon:yes gene_type:complete
MLKEGKRIHNDDVTKMADYPSLVALWKEMTESGDSS